MVRNGVINTANYNARIQQKSDTLANWTASNPVLLFGEIVAATGCSTDEGPSIRLKIGDGATTFNNLDFLDADIVTAIMSVYDTLSEHTQAITDLQAQLSSVQTVYVGSDTPDNTLGNDGDIYLKMN